MHTVELIIGGVIIGLLVALNLNLLQLINDVSVSCPIQ